MEPITLMPAPDAKHLSQQKAITIANVESIIISQCENGNTFARFFDVKIPFDVMQAILQSGYSVSQTTGPIGEHITIISW